MISRISIKDFAIIQNLNVDFKEGLNIITGETGAGKSIVIEAISQALGGRADSTYVRSGCSKAIIQVVLDINGQRSILTREILSGGKSFCKINDEIVTLSALHKFCRPLVDIHGQYANQSLLNPENHITLLDSYLITESGDSYVQNYAAAYEEYATSQKELDLLLKSISDNSRRLDFLKFEHHEITNANLFQGEEEKLNADLLLQQNSEKIYSNLSVAFELLHGDSEVPCVSEMLSKALSSLREITPFADSLTGFEAALSENYYNLLDICNEIRNYKDTIDFSPNLMEETASRIDFLNVLKRKYRKSIEQIIEYAHSIEPEISLLENFEVSIETLSKKVAVLKEKLLALGKSLSKQRKQCAQKLAESTMKELTELHFKDAHFQVHITTNTDKGGNIIFSQTGFDQVEFMISANRGESLKPLAKVASGGEISRIMLAFKRMIGDYDHIPTMIFDEIDVGISGMTASIVGIKLAQIAKKHQVICITHLPQIAAMGDYNYRIYKTSDENSTKTTVEPITQQEKIMEIATLLGGMETTQTTIENAKEMIEKAKKQKSSI